MGGHPLPWKAVVPVPVYLLLTCVIGVPVADFLFLVATGRFRIGKDRGKAIRGALGTVAAGVIVGLLAFVLVGTVLGSVLPTKWVRVSSTPIVAMQDGAGVRGSFFLFGGTVKDTFSYRYLKLRADGGEQYGETDAKHSVVFQEDRTDGVVETWKRVPQDPYGGWGFSGMRSAEYRYRVPKGTVAVEGNYKVDLQ